MSLKIIQGRSGSGKSTYILDDMPEDAPVIYIVPEQFSFTAEKMLIKKFGMVGLPTRFFQPMAILSLLRTMLLLKCLLATVQTQ